MKNTGIFATEEELNKLKEMAETASRTPVIALSSEQALRGQDFASQAWERVRKECHAAALAHGLPEVTGFYGLTADGEFVEAED